MNKYIPTEGEWTTVMNRLIALENRNVTKDVEVKFVDKLNHEERISELERGRNLQKQVNSDFIKDINDLKEQPAPSPRRSLLDWFK